MLSYSWLVQETDISQEQEQDFSLEKLTFTRIKHSIGFGALAVTIF